MAHSLTVVMLNLTGARRALASDPIRADEALQRAEIVGRDSLASIRQVMVLLREPGSVSTLPEPSIAGIETLVAGYRSAGLDVELHLGKSGVAVGPTVELVVYRLIQESLSNVIQHAPGATATIELDVHDVLVVTVTNGPGAEPPVARTARIGLGTRGMFERVRTLGGTFEAGATPTGGWRIHATLPINRRVIRGADHG